MKNHVRPPVLSISNKKRKDTIKANCERYRVHYINPSMSVDDRHEMFREIIETKEMNKKQNETTHMRGGQKENNRMENQQKRKKRYQPKERVGKQNVVFGIKRNQKLKHQMKRDVKSL